MNPCKEYQGQGLMPNITPVRILYSNNESVPLMLANWTTLLQFNIRGIFSQYDHGMHPGLILLSHDILPAHTKIVYI